MHFASKNHLRSNKPCRMISLRQMRLQLPWIDILTRKHRGWGYVLSSYPVRREALSRASKLESSPNPAHSGLSAPDDRQTHFRELGQTLVGFLRRRFVIYSGDERIAISASSLTGVP